MKNFLLVGAVIIAASFLTSCASVSDQKAQSASPEKIYKRNLSIQIDGKKFQGTYLAPNKKAYKIKIRSKVSVELLKINTCHREETALKIGRKHEYTYVVTPLEQSRPCPMEIGAFDTKGKHAWAFIDFYRGGIENLSATLSCNGAATKSTGASLCQARAGLLQMIQFNEAVKVKSPSKDCSVPQSRDGKIWKVKISPKKCIYVFYKSSKSIHRLTTLGFQDYLFTGF